LPETKRIDPETPFGFGIDAIKEKGEKLEEVTNAYES